MKEQESMFQIQSNNDNDDQDEETLSPLSPIKGTELSQNDESVKDLALQIIGSKDDPLKQLENKLSKCNMLYDKIRKSRDMLETILA